MSYLRLIGYCAIPLAYIGHWLLSGRSWEPYLTFILAAVGAIPLAALIGESTEELAEKTGPTWGGLLNATFGNAAELIIGVIALSKGLNEMVKASLTGSILGNLLIVAGGAMVVGGWNRQKQKFNVHSAETSGGMLALAVAAMLMPAIFQHTATRLGDVELVAHEHGISIATSIVLIVIYGLGLLFTLKTHAQIFSHAPAEAPRPAGRHWSVKRSVIVLLVASAAIGFVAELLVGSAEVIAVRQGWNDVFVGIILLALVGNAAEHSTAMILARHDDMNTAMSIVYQSSLQIALFATPALVLISAGMAGLGLGRSQFMDLLFTPMEVAAVILTVGIVVILAMDGESNWFEGALLVGLYLILGIVFFYIPRAA